MTVNEVVNPFTVRTPEGLSALDTKELFVDVFTDFYKIRDPGHSMLNGPRGSGKSMMFRFLEPDCQCLEKNCKIPELDFFAILVSIKNLGLNLTELRRLSHHHFNIVLNEHFLTTYVTSKIFNYIATLEIDPQNEYVKDISGFVNNVVKKQLVRCGMSRDKLPQQRYKSTKEVFGKLGELFDDLYSDVIQFIKRLPPLNEAVPTIDSPLCGYLDFLYPVLKELRTLPFMPDNPIYLLVDDADVLNLTQTRILNSWVGTRTSSEVSIKISTQNRYKTLAKVSGGAIESPHDYSEVNIIDVYTTNRGTYLRRIREIVQKRLIFANIKGSPEEFFPVFQKQENRIKKIKEDIRNGTHKVSGKGYRSSDDVVRYARPIYMAGLAGTKKSSSKYMYAGFDELVHISSGLIRYFLDPAALMFSEQQAKNSSTSSNVEFIEPGIQDEEIKKMSYNLLNSEFDRIVSTDFQNDDIQEQSDGSGESVLEFDINNRFQIRKRTLKNLIRALGGTFRLKLLSEDSERRVFSIAISDNPTLDVVDILELGVQHGYFQISSIGNKDGTGRTTLYILTRRLAPFFRLDPSGFAGYLFVTNEKLREAMNNPDKLLRKIKKQGAEKAFGNERQLLLFEAEDM